MTTLQWDHAVQFVNQPEAAIEVFAGQQLRAAVGGRHPGWGTRNALSYFGLTYIEFLAISDPDELRAATDRFLLSRDAARLLQENEALFRVALRSDDIDATHDHLRRKGLDVPHPLGDIVLEQAVFEVDNPQAVRDRWQALLGFPSQGEQGLDAGGQWFIFRQGPANQLAELVFRVANPALKGQRFRVGNGVYRFI